MSLETVSSFPHRVRSIEHVWIPMSDGCRLAARIWLPEGAEEEPVPAILEYIPYRRRDKTRPRDQLAMPYVAGHGYACVRVDIRGSGDSEGVLQDEYLELEQQDGVEIIRWLAEQSWCDGTVGIIGISWGGFNGLQIAAHRPPELKAVISLCSTDDRYADDVHYMGGCLLGDNLSWASVMFAYNSCPPDPHTVGEKWREMWFERLEHSGLWLETWLNHPRRDDYWKHGSICEDYSAIQVPVLLASGWADGYSNAIFRMLEKLDVPRKAMIGPWSHVYPHLGQPGPAIGFLQESVRWWDHWLKGIDRGVDDDPMLRVYMQDSVPPHTTYEERPGRWVGEPQWPSPNVESRHYGLERGSLCLGPRSDDLPEREIAGRSPLSIGMFAGKWCSYAAPPDLPHDQRLEDGGALVYDTDPLEEDVEILGAPVVELKVSSNRPVAMIAVRLSDVAPNANITRVTYGLLNLTHRESNEFPERLVPRQPYQVRVQLNDVAQRFPKGHRIRVALSTSYFPMAWPPPAPTTLKLFERDCTVILPVRYPRPEDAKLRELPGPAAAKPSPVQVHRPPEHRWTVHYDLGDDTTTLQVIKDEGQKALDEIDLEVRENTTEWYGFSRGEYESVFGEVHSTRAFERPDWKIRTETRTRLTSDVSHFFLHATLDAYEGEARVFAKTWNLSIPRDHV